MTGCRTLSEFYDLTDPLERRLIVKSIDAYYEAKSGDGGGQTTNGPPGGF